MSFYNFSEEIEEEDLSLIDEDIVGKGLQYPAIFNTLGGCNYNTGVDRIKQSIFQILSTPIGSRFFLPEFGSRLFELIFEPNDFILVDLANIYVVEAIKKWENRIVIDDVDIRQNSQNDLIFEIHIRYHIKYTNKSDSYVYPLIRELKEVGGNIFGL